MFRWVITAAFLPVLSAQTTSTEPAPIALSGVIESLNGVPKLIESVQNTSTRAIQGFAFVTTFTDPDTGMTAGRARADGVPYDPNRRYIGSIAVTGFGLAGLCIASERGWVKPEEARTRVRNGLRFFAEHAPQAAMPSEVSGS